MVEYAEEQYTFCGKTGTLPELIKDCPFDKSKMTLESKNKFAVGIMNESGSTIKEEHMPYFQEVVESRNQELKVKVREEPNAALIAEKVDSSIDHAQIDEPANYHETNREVNAVTQEIEAQKMVLQDVHETSPEEEPETLQVDEWLTQLQEEYARRQHEVFDEQLEVHDIEVVKDENEPVVEISIEEEPRQPAIVETERRSRNEIVPVLQSEKKVEHSFDAELTQPDKIVEAPQSTAILVKEEVIAEEPAMNAEIEDDTRAILVDEVLRSEVTAEVDDQVIAMDNIEFIEFSGPVVEQSETIIEGTSSEADNQPIKEDEPLAIAELLPEYEIVEFEESKTLIEHIIDYVEFSEVIKPEKVEGTYSLLEEVKAIVSDVAVLEDEVSIDRAEEITELKHRLEEVCEVILENLGIEYDEEILMRFVSTISEEIIKNQASLKDLEDMNLDEGTHEHKTFTLNDFMFTWQSKMLDFRLIGRFALSYPEANT